MRIGQIPQIGVGAASTRPAAGLLYAHTNVTQVADTEPLGPLPPVAGTTRVAAATAVDAAASARDVARIDAALRRTATALASARKPDGHWDTVYVGGNTQMAVAAIALADAGVDATTAKNAEVMAHFASAQLADGGFPVIPGEPADPGTTRLVAIAVTMMAKLDPSLAARASAIAAECQRYLVKHPTHAIDGLYALTANLLADVTDENSHLIPALPASAMLTQLTDTVASDHLSNLARVCLPAFGLLMEQKARHSSWLMRHIGASSDSTVKAFEDALMRSQDGDGAWGWTGFGTALAVMALERQGYTPDTSPALRRGIAFLEQLRAQDITAWTHGDAWDTAYATLTLQSIAPTIDVSQGMDVLMHGQLADGRFSFSIQGILGDDDTSSVALRSMCARYAVTTIPAERERLASAIAHTTRGLLDYQRREGGWGSSNKRSLPPFDELGPPSSPTVSALNDVQSPDLSGRVISALIDAQNSGALAADMSAKVSIAITKGTQYLKSTRNKDGSWWSRWTCGPLSSFAYVVPALRRAGETASSPVFAHARELILSQQNADGGWGDEIASDRHATSVTERGRSSIAHTVSAMIGLIGTTKNDDPEVHEALHHAAAYLLRNENAGVYANGRNLYTQLTGLDYYDSDNWTTCLAAAALQLYRDYLRDGPDAAMRRFSL